ncbi:stress-response protein [Budviciaceae bacterium BWR-B9]|uniref:Stress-response protein n=2 Tax=Budviciaceae TaxID=1903416 RepID=A0ABS1IPH8_9GAMM|nr:MULTISPECIES: stress-response protein [Limnobaculum]MBK5143200.1 stress-response protein [Limnobaculum allomyrinae]MBV7691088.1 stress-response protein [Limnobaculum sp. M2-1]
MNSDIILGRLKQWKGSIRLWWAEMAGIEDEFFAGNSDWLSGILQEDYGKEQERVSSESRTHH